MPLPNQHFLLYNIDDCNYSTISCLVFVCTQTSSFPHLLTHVCLLQCLLGAHVSTIHSKQLQLVLYIHSVVFPYKFTSQPKLNCLDRTLFFEILFRISFLFNLLDVSVNSRLMFCWKQTQIFFCWKRLGFRLYLSINPYQINEFVYTFFNQSWLPLRLSLIHI